MNLYDGHIFYSGSSSVPIASTGGASLVFGSVLDRTPNRVRANIINTYLIGANAQATYCFGICMGVNHAIGGLTAIEWGLGTPGFSGGLGYGFSAGTALLF